MGIRKKWYSNFILTFAVTMVKYGGIMMANIFLFQFSKFVISGTVLTMQQGIINNISRNNHWTYFVVCWSVNETTLKCLAYLYFRTKRWRVSIILNVFIKAYGKHVKKHLLLFYTRELNERIYDSKRCTLYPVFQTWKKFRKINNFAHYLWLNVFNK